MNAWDVGNAKVYGALTNKEEINKFNTEYEVEMDNEFRECCFRNSNIECSDLNQPSIKEKAMEFVKSCAKKYVKTNMKLSIAFLQHLVDNKPMWEEIISVIKNPRYLKVINEEIDDHPLTWWFRLLNPTGKFQAEITKLIK